MNANRSRRREGWPPGLYESRPGYYYWKRGDRKAEKIGRVPLAHAKAEAMAANAWLESRTPTLVERLSGVTAQTVGDLLGKMPTPENKNTAKSVRSMDKKLKTALGSVLCHDLTVKRCADLIEAEVENVGARSAQALRSRLVAVCKRGLALGWLDANPAEVTQAPTVKTKRERLTLESFRAIYARAAEVSEWLPLAMRLALVTGADVTTLSGLQRSMVADDTLTYRRSKTGAWVAVPLALRLDVQGWCLRDLVAERTPGIISPWLVHHVRPWGRAPAGSRVTAQRISKAFAKARDLAGYGDRENPPTMYECRSLAKRLYEAQGGVDTKALLGHATERMSAMYADPRGAEPVRVRVANGGKT